MSSFPIPQKKPLSNTFDRVINNAENIHQLVDRYIVAPAANLGIAGLEFDIPTDTKVDLSAETTDHYVENNSAIQDHLSVKPTIITLRGFVGELIEDSGRSDNFLEKAVKKLTIVNDLVPSLTDGAKQARDDVKRAKNTRGKLLTADNGDFAVSAITNLYSTYQKINPPRTKQAQAFNFFRALFEGKQLVSVDTPYGFYDQMAIIGVSSLQGEKTRDMTDFVITLKQVRFAETQLSAFDFSALDKFQRRAKGQNSEIIDNGKAQGKKEPRQSLLKRFRGG